MAGLVLRWLITREATWPGLWCIALILFSRRPAGWNQTNQNVSPTGFQFWRVSIGNSSRTSSHRVSTLILEKRYVHFLETSFPMEDSGVLRRGFHIKPYRSSLRVRWHTMAIDTRLYDSITERNRDHTILVTLQGLKGSPIILPLSESHTGMHQSSDSVTIFVPCPR